MDFLKDVFGGANIFGASGNNTNSLVKNGLLQQTDVDKADNQSLFRGLLGTAVGYLAQPKNQGYGSSIPYIFKGLQNGMDQAQQPFDQLTKNAGQNMKLEKYQRELAQNKRADANQVRADEIRALQDNLFVSTPGATTSTNAGNAVINQTGADGSAQIGPNMGHLPETTTGPATMQMDPAVLEQIKFKNPQLYAQYIGNQKTEAEIAEMNGPSEIKMAAPRRENFTQPSWEEYQRTNNQAVLDPNTEEVKQKIKESKAKTTYEYGDSIGSENMQTTVKTNVAGGAEKPLELKMPYSGISVIPRMYRPNVPGKIKLKLDNERGKRTSALVTGSSNMRQERKLIREVINGGSLPRITGVKGMFYNKPGGDAANAEALLETIKQKEFLNNYLGIKEAGGGFGALSEKEGERLERMRTNLDQAQSAEQIEEVLRELDSILEDTENALYESYAVDYGSYDYKPKPLPEWNTATKTMPGGRGITVTRIN